MYIKENNENVWYNWQWKNVRLMQRHINIRKGNWKSQSSDVYKLHFKTCKLLSPFYLSRCWSTFLRQMNVENWHYELTLWILNSFKINLSATLITFKVCIKLMLRIFKDMTCDILAFMSDWLLSKGISVLLNIIKVETKRCVPFYFYPVFNSFIWNKNI